MADLAVSLRLVIGDILGLDGVQVNRPARAGRLAADVIEERAADALTLQAGSPARYQSNRCSWWDGVVSYRIDPGPTQARARPDEQERRRLVQSRPWRREA